MRSVALAGMVACLAALGCAMRIPPAQIQPHLPEVTDQGALDRLRLGVGIFVDSRPLEDREEARPPLRVSGLELARRGDVRTGDASFVGDVAAGIRRDAIATLLRSGTFSSVRSVQVDAATARGGQIPDDLDLILTAEIEEFGAVQYRNSGLHPFRIGWMRSYFGDPLGFARIRYQIDERSGRSQVHMIEAEHVSEGQTITDAALDAMAVANESLARRLYADWLPKSASSYRVVPVRVLDACGLPGRRASELMRSVSEVFEREAGLRFRSEIEGWGDPPVRADLKEVLAEVRRQVPTADGIVLALVPRRRLRTPAFTAEPFGLAIPFGQHVVVRCEADGRIPLVTVIHELGHLFGAVHARDRNSVMHPVAGFDGRFFDTLNRRILRVMCERPFDAPLPPGTARRLRSIYATAARYPESYVIEDLEVAISALATPNQDRLAR